MRRKITPSLVISVLALFVALGGTSYAISKLPKNSVGTKQIKNNAVVSSKVKDKSLVAKDFKPGQIPAGKQGPTGTTGTTGTTGVTGDTGPAGSALAYAYVEGQASPPDVVPEKSKGITTAMVSSPSTGVYCFELSSLGPVKSANVTAEPSFGSPATSNYYGMVQVLPNNTFDVGCPADSDAMVVMKNTATSALVGWFFYITVN